MHYVAPDFAPPAGRHRWYTHLYVQVLVAIVAGMALILGVDRFMNECRSLTNFIGNAVASVIVARWEGVLDREKLDAGAETPRLHK